MKKTFPFSVPGKDAARVVEAIKHDVRKYLKRERRKALPEGVDYLDFDCRIGQGKETPIIKQADELITAIDEAFHGGALEVYVEILAKPGIRTGKKLPPETGKADKESRKP